MHEHRHWQLPFCVGERERAETSAEKHRREQSRRLLVLGGWWSGGARSSEKRKHKYGRLETGSGRRSRRSRRRARCGRAAAAALSFERKPRRVRDGDLFG